MAKYLRWFALVALASLSACASVPMATADLDVQGKRFQAPPPGKAAFYIYRESIFGGAYSLNVTMGPRTLGTLAADTWFLVDVDPGQYDMRCNAPKARIPRSSLLRRAKPAMSKWRSGWVSCSRAAPYSR